MPPDNSKFKSTKTYINGKEISCEIYEFDNLDYINDIDDFGLHFDPAEKEIALSFQLDMNFVEFAKLLGIWDKLRWYQKLWCRICSWFGI